MYFPSPLYNGTVWYVDVSHRIEIWLELVSVDYDVPGRTSRRSSASCIPAMDALRILILSISSASTITTAHARGLFLYHGTEPGTH